MSDGNHILDISDLEAPETEAEKSGAVITVNFKNRAIIDKMPVEGNGNIPKFLRDIAKMAKQNDLRSVVVLTIDKDRHVDWTHLAESDHHLALAALCLDDLREDLKAAIFSDQG